MNVKTKELIFEIINTGKKIDNLEQMSEYLNHPIKIKDASAKVKKLGLKYKNSKDEGLLNIILEETKLINTQISNEIRACLMIRLKEGKYDTYQVFMSHTANMKLRHTKGTEYTLTEVIPTRWDHYKASSIVSIIDLKDLDVNDLFRIYSGLLITYYRHHNA